MENKCCILCQEAASVLGTTWCSGNVTKEQAPCSSHRRIKISFTADPRLEGRVTDLYRWHLPIMVPLFSPQAHCFCTFNYSSLLPGNAVVAFLTYLSSLAFIWLPAGSNRFQQAPFPCSSQNGVWCDAATVFYARKLGSSTSAGLLFPHPPKQRKKQKSAFRNNLPIDFDRT